MLKFGIISLFLVFLGSSWLNLVLITLTIRFIWLILSSSYNFGVISWVLVDNVSFVLILLSFWITSLILISRYYVHFANKFTTIFSSLIILIIIFLILCFRSSNFLVFYILFEASLIPIFLLVLGWGYQPERVTASYYLLFYTLTASLPLLIGIIVLSDYFDTLELNMLLIESTSDSFLFRVPFFTILILAFLVKIPVYFLHLWLPKAHVEAPVAGSIILAGVLLKLGGYGLIRVFIFREDNLFRGEGEWLIGLRVFGAVLGSLICLCQRDIKSLVAYSSVAHIALVLIGLCTGNYSGLGGAVIIMVAHGLCSSGLFGLVGIVYERLGSRRIIVIRRMLTMAPLISLWWFLFRVANIAAPPSPNLAGEVIIFISSLSYFGFLTLIVGTASFLAAAFNLYLYSGTQQGNIILGVVGVDDTLVREHQVLLFHIIPLLLSLVVLINIFI